MRLIDGKTSITLQRRGRNPTLCRRRKEWGTRKGETKIKLDIRRVGQAGSAHRGEPYQWNHVAVAFRRGVSCAVTMAANSSADERRLRAQQGKEFLISQILEEAEREDVPLSEIERKMLQFTEMQESLPDIYDVNDQFEREYDTGEYEKKIAGLVRRSYRRAKRESSENKNHWKQAVADLRKEDHYPLVMVDQGLELSAAAGYGIGIGIAVLLVASLFLWDALIEKSLIPLSFSRWLGNNSAWIFPSVSYGIAAIWVIVRLSRSGALQDVLKGLYKTLTRSRE